MKVLSYSGPVLLLLCGFIGLIALSTLRKDPPQKATIQQSALVEVAPVVRCDGGFKISVDGEVIPFREISLSAEAAGRIASKSMKARAGKYVRKGDSLFTIDPRDYELEVRRLREMVNQADSSIAESDVEKSNTEELIENANAQLDLYRNEFKRFEGLKLKNAASTSDLERARQAELTSLNSLQALKNQITLINTRRNRLLQDKERAITDLEQAKLNLARTRVVSTIDGVVIQDFAEQDDFVQKGTRLIQLEDTSKVEVRFSLRMDQLRWLWSPDESVSTENVALSYTYDLPRIPIEVSVDLDGNEFTWPARLDRYDGAGINAGTRTIPVIAVVDDPRAVQLSRKSDVVALAAPPTLLRGSFVTITIPVGKDMKLVAVPVTAFQPDKTIWVYDDGVLRIQPVKVAYADDQKVVIMVDSTQLSLDDRVITSPLAVAEDGMAVRLHAVDPSQQEATLTASEPKNSGAG